MTEEPAMTEELEVRWATADDAAQVWEVLDSAAGWLVGRGIHQWPHPYPRGLVERACADGSVRVGCRDGQILATMRTLRNDPDVWGDDLLPALYIHSLACRRDPSARGSGGVLLGWAARAAAADGLAAVRLDCWAQNQPLRDYYARAGFQHVDDVTVRYSDADWRCSRFEMAVKAVQEFPMRTPQHSRKTRG
jgi:predicted N-acetyltransferase YhbS